MYGGNTNERKERNERVGTVEKNFRKYWKKLENICIILR